MENKELKTDRLGRTFHSAEEREQILRECDASGKSHKEFALERNLNYKTLTDWYARQRKTKRRVKLKALDTRPLFSIGGSKAEAIAEVVCGGVTVRLYRESSGKFLKDLLGVVR